MNTDWFFMNRDELQQEGLTYLHLRRICSDCPLRKDCLSYAFQNENYGMWGAMTSQERASIDEPLKYPNQRIRGLQALKELGISLRMIKECKEAK